MWFVTDHHECSLHRPWCSQEGFSPRSAVPLWLEGTRFGCRTKREEEITQTSPVLSKVIICLDPRATLLSLSSLMLVFPVQDTPSR